MKKIISKPLSNRFAAALLACILMFGVITGNLNVSGKRAWADATPPEKFVMNVTDMALSDKIESNLFAGTDNFFKLLATPLMSMKITTNGKTIDGFSFKNRLQFNGAGSTTERAIEFTTATSGTLTVYAITGSGQEMRNLVLDSLTGEPETKGVGDPIAKYEFTLPAADTYYLYCQAAVNLYYAEVNAGAAEIIRKPWAEVTAPVLGVPAQNEAKINVPFTMDIGNDGADSVTIEMLSGTAVVDTKTSSDTVVKSIDFTPPSSGDYSFKIKASRVDEADKIGEADATLTGFVLPLVAPVPRAYTTSVTEEGSKLSVTFGEVKEASSYRVEYKKSADAGYIALPEISAVAGQKTYVAETPALTAGDTYNFKVVALRGNDESTAGTCTALVRDVVEYDWSFAAYGPSASASKNKVEGNVFDGLKISSTGGGGKLQDSGADGMGFYYTAVPKDKNFVLSAKIKVDSWVLSNGQEGFMAMVRDSAPTHGNTVEQYSNSFGFISSKVEYYYDTEEQTVSDVGDAKITMKLGLGVRTLTGMKKANVAPSKEELLVNWSTLETSYGGDGPGEYNIVKNGTKTVGGDNNVSCGGTLEEFLITIKKTNTGFYIIYTDEKGVSKEEILYDWQDLFVIDENNVYVGFAASRNMVISVSEIKFSTTIAANDPPATERPIKLIAPNYKVTSSTATGTENYNLRFVANADGKLAIKDLAGTIIVKDAVITAETEYIEAIKLTPGANGFKVTFKPNDDYVPGPFMKLSSYAEETINHNVLYKKFGAPGKYIYVATTGNAGNNGSRENPLDIASAFKHAQAGQTIVLKAETYSLYSNLTIARGIDGTEQNPIQVIPEAGATVRPVLDFKASSAGIIHWGNYWIFRGFDVTNTSDTQKGIQVSGSHNKLLELNTYNNGNTGIQVSGISTEPFERWPAYNEIINCTSYNNADAGFEDADGFAAKLTTGPGNVFDGCIAYNNADDGWDLFAKTQTGAIGAVTVKNSIAYNNGFLVDGTNAGNGNGFKMGGTSLAPVDADGNASQHLLQNSIAFNNKAKGIDSNSCPGFKVVNSTTFNNGSYNVAFYTNAGTTNFAAEGLISFRTNNKTIGESIKLNGQDNALVYGKNNFYWGNNGSENSAGSLITKEMFVSLDTTVAPARYPDGGIDVKGLLQLTPEAIAALTEEGITAGAVFTSGLTVTPAPIAIGKAIDGTKPIVAFNADMAASAKKGATVNIKYTASDNSTSIDKLTVEIRVMLGTELVSQGNSFKASKTGDYVITVKITDEDGNFNIATHTVKVTKGSGCGGIIADGGGIMGGGLTVLTFALLSYLLIAATLRKRQNRFGAEKN